MTERLLMGRKNQIKQTNMLPPKYVTNQINSMHILNSGDLPAGRTLCTYSQKLYSTSEGHKVWSPNECFSHLPFSLLPDWSLPWKSALLNDKIVRSFDLCFSALS